MKFQRMIPPRLRRLSECHSLRQSHSFGLHQVHFHGNNLLVTVTKRAAEVDEWVNHILYDHSPFLHSHPVVVGLDIEWHPCFEEGEQNPAATLQLCVGEKCLIFLLLHKDYIPRSLFAFLAHPRFTFVGVGVQDDADKLLRDHGLAVTTVVDLRRLAEQVYGSKHFMKIGLKKMALQILGKVMEKPREVTLSDWDSKNLTFSQIEGVIKLSVLEQMMKHKIEVKMLELKQIGKIAAAARKRGSKYL